MGVGEGLMFMDMAGGRCDPYIAGCIWGAAMSEDILGRPYMAIILFCMSAPWTTIAC